MQMNFNSLVISKEKNKQLSNYAKNKEKYIYIKTEF